MAIARTYQLGWWPQGGRLDSLDGALSLPIMTLQLGALEYAIAVPGTWFGLPPMVWGILPLYVGAFVSDAEKVIKLAWLLGLCMPLTVAGLLVFFRTALKGDMLDLYRAALYLLVPCSIVPPMMAAHFLGPRAGHAVSLVLCAWAVTETICHAFKITARRMRPVVSMADKIGKVKRSLVALQKLVSKGEAALESFPSGDSAGAMVFTMVLLHYGAGLWAWVPALLSSFGRVYFHAHHVLDVSFGMLFGWLGTSSIVDHYGLEDGLGPIHVLLSMVLFALFHVVCRRFMTFEVPAELRSRRSMYGGKATEVPDLAGVTK